MTTPFPNDPAYSRDVRHTVNSALTADDIADDLEAAAFELTIRAEAAALTAGVVRLDWLRADKFADLAARAARMLRPTEGQPHP
jgi:hypothetical protein